MPLIRRDFLARAGLGLTLGLPAACRTASGDRPAPAGSPPDWAAVRAEFPLSRDYIHVALMLLTSHPRPVREAIERHRRGLDENPVDYFEERFGRAEAEVRAAAARFLGGAADDIALTDSTTMGLGVLYGGLPVRPDQEILTTTHDHFATHENLRLRAARQGASFRKVALYERPAAATEEQVVGRLVGAIGPRTRVVAVTWVHSSTGVKLPIRRIADEVARLNAGRAEADRVVFCVDGVHGLGAERERPPELGCDFLVAGCHKWLFGPRGTGLVWGRAGAWQGHVGLIAAFEEAPYKAWIRGETPAGPGGPMASPGGFHSFEHRWALGEAFRFHDWIGRERITERIHALASQCKEGLSRMSHVELHTPRDPALSAALVCFEVKGLRAPEVVKRLHARKIIASVTPYATEYARLSPGALNTPEEMETVLREIRALA
jgi:selenocysteine lyase/cysteine desulfurase